MLPSFGVQFSNQMSGVFQLQALQGSEGAARLEITGQLPNLLQALLSARVALQGVISLAGFADEKPVTGEMELAALQGVKMQLQFADNQGNPCRLEVAKGFDLGDALKGKTELPASLLGKSGEALGTVRLDVDLLQSFGQFWGSLRPTGGPAAPGTR